MQADNGQKSNIDSSSSLKEYTINDSQENRIGVHLLSNTHNTKNHGGGV